MASADRLVVVDDAVARRFEPFALTRPIGSLRAGALRITERWERVAAIAPASHVAAAHLEAYSEPGARAVSTRGTLPAGTLVATSRCAPALDARVADGDVVRCGDRVAAVRLDAPMEIDALVDADALERLASNANRATTIRGWWMDEVWDPIRHLQEMLTADVPVLAASVERERLPEGVLVIGDRGHIFVERGATIEPGACIDVSASPVLVRRNAVVQAFTRLTGPAYVAEHSTVAGDRVSGCSIGEWCKVRGEISTSVMLAYSNKGHDGFVGHSYLGSWVNLGAGTTTSNLKNTYGSVSLWTPNGIRDTGLQFLGTLFGDHVKTGIGLTLTTGTVLGAAANVYDRMPPKVVPPFAWGSGAPYGSFELDRFLVVAERMMSRRHVTLDDRGRDAVRAAYAARWNVNE